MVRYPHSVGNISPSQKVGMKQNERQEERGDPLLERLQSVSARQPSRVLATHRSPTRSFGVPGHRFSKPRVRGTCVRDEGQEVEAVSHANSQSIVTFLSISAHEAGVRCLVAVLEHMQSSHTVEMR